MRMEALGLNNEALQPSALVDSMILEKLIEPKEGQELLQVFYTTNLFTNIGLPEQYPLKHLQ